MGRGRVLLGKVIPPVLARVPVVQPVLRERVPFAVDVVIDVVVGPHQGTLVTEGQEVVADGMRVTDVAPSIDQQERASPAQ